MRARAPGRVNLIGDHTDYTGGLVLPMAVNLETVVDGTREGDHVSLVSADEPERALVSLSVDDPAAVSPPWARYVAGVVAVLRPATGVHGTVFSTLPLGAGLSSSAALEVAVALAVGFEGTPLELAHACQEAEQRASGVPCGIMDQLASAAGVEGHALLIDCTTFEVMPVPVPDGLDVVVVHSGVERGLGGTAYAQRRAECEAAARQLGPLRDATLADAEGIDDPVIRRRARHVVSENARVQAFAEALAAGRTGDLGPLMAASHASLRDDFEVSIPALDDLVEHLASTPGVLGARLTGAGFGGCVVALAEPGAAVDGWRVRAATGATVEN
ncbi:MAG TPA: galactokinase [Acidimicrobiales bacterium]|nr:galactokinase [Acidimicrobiales bacterium]